MRLLSQVASWLVTLIVIRLLAPSDYGLLALAQLLIGLATLLNQIGLTPALIQARTLPEHILRSVFGFVLASNAVLYAAVYVAAPRFAEVYGSPDLVPVIRVLGLQLLIGGIGAVPTALATRDMAFKHLSVIGLVATIVGSALSLIIAVMDGGVWALVNDFDFTVQAYASGRATIGRVRTAAVLHPGQNPGACRLDFEPMESGIRFNVPPVARPWLEYRMRCPQLTGTDWSATATYTVATGAYNAAVTPTAPDTTPATSLQLVDTVTGQLRTITIADGEETIS